MWENKILASQNRLMTIFNAKQSFNVEMIKRREHLR